MSIQKFCVILAAATAITHPSLALASLSEMASTPLVRVNIAESLRTPPDEASMTVNLGERSQRSALGGKQTQGVNAAMSVKAGRGYLTLRE